MVRTAPTALRARTTLRRTARHGALNALSALSSWTGRTQAGLRQPRVHLPYLHAVPPGEEGTFRAFVAELARSHELISYSEAVRRIRHGPIDSPSVAFSFDDGFASNVRTAKILEEFGTTGMFFVPAGFVGTPSLDEARAFFGYTPGVNEPAMTWGDLERLKESGHEIGNHTWSHRVLSELSTEEMRDDICRGADAIRRRLGECEHFAWPRGRFIDFNDCGAQIVFDTGHVSCASAERGAHKTVHVGPKNLLCLRRDHMMSDWPQRHCRYFIGRSGLRNDPTVGSWPDGWKVDA